jgi:hypothetical protein
MLDVANGPILADKSSKNPFLVKFPKSEKTPSKKKKLNQVGFSMKHAEHSGEENFHF